MKPQNLWNHETYETMKPMKPWNHETYETIEPLKPWNLWKLIMKPMKPQNVWNYETYETKKPLKLWNLSPRLHPHMVSVAGERHQQHDIHFIHPSPSMTNNSSWMNFDGISLSTTPTPGPLWARSQLPTQVKWYRGLGLSVTSLFFQLLLVAISVWGWGAGRISGNPIYYYYLPLTSKLIWR